ncbi:MAG: hypothetical protein BWX73_00908 [Lentisphaerae bacterium ADurb.Bin082]|nr:MAG: hypothetical protein BWX73_00908 [Lentisphaerae bacterium ADurb.Bin082]
MQKLIIPAYALRQHRLLSDSIKKILEWLASGNALYLSSRASYSIKLSRTLLQYFKQLYALYKKVDFLLADIKQMSAIIEEEEKIRNTICSGKKWSEEDEKQLNGILVRIFGYDEGFSKSKYIHLETKPLSNGGERTSIVYSDEWPKGNNSWGAGKYLRALRIRYCAYCNAESVSAFDDINGHLVSGDYSHHTAFDHFYEKTKYPFLALTLRNLVPACFRCNTMIRNAKPLNKQCLNPYDGSFDELVSFKYDKKTVEEYYWKYDPKHLLLESRNPLLTNNNPAIVLNDEFRILDCYKTLYDVEIGEFYRKLIWYNRHQLDGTFTSFPQLSGSIGRKFFLGVTFNKCDINLHRFGKLFLDFL